MLRIYPEILLVFLGLDRCSCHPDAIRHLSNLQEPPGLRYSDRVTPRGEQKERTREQSRVLSFFTYSDSYTQEVFL